MTIPRPPLAAVISANEAFKLRYPRYLKGAVLAALALTALFVWLWPGYQAKPYQLRQEEIITLIDVDPVAPIVEPPKPVEAPRLPPIIEPVPRDDPDAVDLPPEFWNFDDPYLPWTPPPPTDEGFVPSSAKPVLEYQAKPDYPEIARRAGIEGTVLVQVRVDVNGRVERAEILQGVHPLLNRSAVEAALRCRFTPAKQRQKPVAVWVAIPYRFRLQ